jgi:hypothetical protein
LVIEIEFEDDEVDVPGDVVGLHAKVVVDQRDRIMEMNGTYLSWLTPQNA